MIQVPCMQQTCPKNYLKLFFSQASAIKRFLPLFDRVLVERFAPELKTKGGIMLPEKSQGKVLQATVVATGNGNRDQVKQIKIPTY